MTSKIALILESASSLSTMLTGSPARVSVDFNSFEPEMNPELSNMALDSILNVRTVESLKNLAKFRPGRMSHRSSQGGALTDIRRSVARYNPAIIDVALPPPAMSMSWRAELGPARKRQLGAVSKA